jgi:hypothetical protein
MHIGTGYTAPVRLGQRVRPTAIAAVQRLTSFLSQVAGRVVVGVDLGERQASQSGVRGGGGNGIEDV